MTGKKAGGRPSSYSDSVAAELCERVSMSDYGLEQICAADDMPSARTVYRWLSDPEREGFRQKYARAKEVQGHVQFDRGLKDALTAKDAQLGRLKLDARKWAASKLAPKVYGEKVAVEASGPNGGPIETRGSLDVSALSEAALRELAALKT